MTVACRRMRYNKMIFFIAKVGAGLADNLWLTDRNHDKTRRYNL